MTDSYTATASSAIASLISKRIRADVRDTSAYKVADASGMIKLDAMENPYVLPDHLQESLGQRLGALDINRYPSSSSVALQTQLAEYLDIAIDSPSAQADDNLQIVLGNGSDELIQLIITACAQPNAVVMAPEPGFVMYRISASHCHVAYEGVSLQADFSLDVSAMRAAMDVHQPAVLFLAYPNNPTANLWSADDVEALIQHAISTQTIVVMDEAYQPFSSDSWLDRIKADPARYAHVVLMRTLSKFGLAGVRLGYMVAHRALAGEIDKVRPPYNISVLNAECALFALEHADVYAAQATEIRQQREALSDALKEIGFEVFPSQANMILVRHEDSQRIFQELKARKILIKNTHGSHPLLHNCLRITVGSAEENTTLVDALHATLDIPK